MATDIAARGIDVTHISHVINYDMPDTAEAYTHRIGRTGRAAHTGDAFTLVTDEDDEMVRAIERVLGEDRAAHPAGLRLQRARARAQRRVRPAAARAAPREGDPG